MPVLPAVVKGSESEAKPEAHSPPPPPEKKLEKHTILIQRGENLEKAVFTREEGTKTWKHGQVGRAPDDDGDAPNKEPSDETKPAPRPGSGNRR
jgi:hypothetical protein